MHRRRFSRSSSREQGRFRSCPADKAHPSRVLIGRPGSAAITYRAGGIEGFFGWTAGRRFGSSATVR